MCTCPAKQRYVILSLLALIVSIFHSDISLIVCFQLWILDDFLSHYLGLHSVPLFRLKNAAFDLHEHYYSAFDPSTQQDAMLPLILNASQYHSYARLKSISNEFRQPVVIRNLFKSSNAMNWNLSYLNTTIGREECHVLLPHSQYFESDRESKLYSHILRNISNHGWNYVSGDQNILFNASNDLIYDLNLRQILGDEYLHSPDFLPDELYFFVGNAYGGTAWHSAPNRSLFVLLKGLKRWIFIDPKYAVYLKPQRSQLYSRILLLFGRFIQHTKHINHFEDSHSLYRHIPHYEVVLRPGDAITVPSWWWHHVTNLDDETEDDGLNIGIDIDTKQWNYDFLRSIFPRFV